MTKIKTGCYVCMTEPFRRNFRGDQDQVTVGLMYLISPDGIAYLKWLKKMKQENDWPSSKAWLMR